MEEEVTFEDWDPADDIETKEDVIAFLEVALEENDPAFLLRTIGHISRSKGMAELIRDFGQNRDEPDTSFPERETPSFLTMTKVLDNLGFKLSIERKLAS